jgi:hypothetical protein
VTYDLKTRNLAAMNQFAERYSGTEEKERRQFLSLFVLNKGSAPQEEGSSSVVQKR